ncbi:ATP-dependent helicase [Paenibacillus sp. YYML68]|uniref:ATP-dependent helicase n=1 Tax=Paenibacillus sp. YYML68 TaxID=2909250 RepID=UPI0037C6E7A2
MDHFLERKKQELGVSLNDVQKQAVLQTEGPLLLLASPGSGKTTTLIMRIGALIEVKGIHPSRIKAVTFSRAAASDMKARYERFFPQLPPVQFSTIHSLAYEVMREHYRRTGTAYQIIEGELDLEDQETIDWDANPPLHKKLILRKLFASITGDTITDDQMDELTTYISYVKNKLLPRDRWELVPCSVPHAVRILDEYEAYKRSGTANLLIDFDDMLTIGHTVLEEQPELLRKYQRRYDYVLTDESQDTSLVQHAIIEKLARQHGNLCVVADDDQSIYSWRGAEPSYLLEFKQVYPQATILYMEQNYRSTQDIVHVAAQFIKRNQDRYDKSMFTLNGKHEPISIRSLADYKLQAKYVVQQIQKCSRLSEIAVLYRNNSSSIGLMNEFDRAGIPFYMKDADNRFFSHWVVEDILNFMRMTFTDKRTELLEKIHLKLSGYISKQQMAAVKQIQNNESVFDNLLQHVKLHDYQVKLIEECRDTLREMKGMPPQQAIKVIRSRLGYEKAIEKMCDRLGFRKEYLIGILNTLEEIADSLATMEDFAARLKYLESVLRGARHRKGQNAVTFSTLHSAKGLEFEQVYMIDLIDGILPSKDDVKAKESKALLEEATRLFYVGMTRAKKCLELITYSQRDGEKTVESEFVADVRRIMNPEPKSQTSLKSRQVFSKESVQRNPNAIRELAELAPGKRVKHRVFGIGSIEKRTVDRVYVQFPAGVKVLLIETCLEMGLLESAETDVSSMAVSG